MDDGLDNENVERMVQRHQANQTGMCVQCKEYLPCDGVRLIAALRVSRERVDGLAERETYWRLRAERLDAEVQTLTGAVAGLKAELAYYRDKDA